MHAFAVIQSFNRTYRKLGLVPWMCVEKIAENLNYNIFEAGPEMAGAPAPPVDAPESDTFYADQALVAHPGSVSVAEMERSLVEAPVAPPDQSPVTFHTPAGDKAGTEADLHGLVSPLAAGPRPDSHVAMARVPTSSNPRCARSSTCESLGYLHHAHEGFNLAWVKPAYSVAYVIICA